MAQSQPAEDRRHGSGQNHLAEHARTGATQHGRSFKQTPFHRLHAEGGVDDDGKERAKEHQKDGRVGPHAEKDHRQRQPCCDRHRAQHLQRRVHKAANGGVLADDQAQRNADQRRQRKRAIHTRHGLEPVNIQRLAECVVINAAEREVPQHQAHLLGRRHQHGPGPAHGQIPCDQQHQRQHRRQQPFAHPHAQRAGLRRQHQCRILRRITLRFCGLSRNVQRRRCRC
ncbi:hypothetical protein SDC9_135558 [bioreactor metagenome]|uniref:Uncharacterized protein n=1 Tax=bioreactor metagenome TaxID=1076179 RepID=A0A645DG67_9ZZZZ